MKKKQGFFSRLKKSTIITLVSCGSFVVMTFFALLFFVKFPLKPSEKIITSMGRESIYRQNVSYNQTTTTQTTTTETTTKQTTTASTTHKEFVITITTGKGFKTEVKGHDVPVMDYDYDDYSDYEEDNETIITTTVTDYEDNEYDYDWNEYQD